MPSWNAIFIAAALVGLGFGIEELRIAHVKADLLQCQKDAETHRADTNATTAATIATQANTAADTRTQVLAKQRDLAAVSQQTQDRITNAPSTDDGPIAPVLADTLERLRAQARGSADPRS